VDLKPGLHLQLSITRSINIHGAMHRCGVNFFSVGLQHATVNKFLVKTIKDKLRSSLNLCCTTPNATASNVFPYC